MDRDAEGVTFLIKPGIHRLQSVVPKSGNRFIGEPGAILSGARLLSSLSRDGDAWVAANQTQEGPKGYGQGALSPAGVEYKEATYPEDLYIDDQPLLQAGDRASVAPGKFYFDYAGDTIDFADDPTGRRIEASVTQVAFHCGKDIGCRDINIQNLIIEKYACPAQHGAVHARTGYAGPLSENWTVSDPEIRLNPSTANDDVSTEYDDMKVTVHETSTTRAHGVPVRNEARPDSAR